MKKVLSVLAALLVLVGCGAKQSSDDKVIKIGATPLPHAEILNQLKGPLEAQGYTLEVVVFDDYKIPNTEVNAGSLDANYFQHIPYLEDFNEANGTNVVPVLKVHYEPIAIYSGKKTALTDVADGDTVLVPDDATNLPRALKLLEELGWIELNENRDTSTQKDIVKFNKNITIKEIQSDGIAALINDSEYVILNGNYALSSGVTDRALQAETISPEKIAEIVNVVAVKGGNEESDKTKAILKAFEDESVRKYVAEKFAPAVTSVLD
ncbi:metal ABC transporter substrate-binding protein [Erysipelothrix sp. HDW6C]|uniref:MetQ/NlpA family ABC transporter substrate-binding protein n=1 Tax=Erysipelothrix sp. HDW6C TaxID=2714930 RepID=UPI001408D5A9|nr:MetQ/NlpA family ABC transporter substrate-binding protein [Erysipelothrix sp. HDW6C]QIK70216.1 metal ABC transporter substrate-binding protein [Erysipelothrix sp. HDW6C]